MNGERLKSEWIGKREVECRLMADQCVVHRGEELTGVVFLRGRELPTSASKDLLQVIVDLRGKGPRWMIDDFDVAIASCWYRRVAPLAPAEMRNFPFRLSVPSETLAQPAYVVARVNTMSWPHWQKARTSLSIRIGPQRRIEELIFDIAELAEARIQSWGSSADGDTFRARMKPLRSGSRYRELNVEFEVQNGLANGRIHVVDGATVMIHAYKVEMCLSARSECRQLIWRCLQRHIDRSGQLPVPATESVTPIDQLPRPASESMLKPPE